jgi:hypothetical protein
MNVTSRSYLTAGVAALGVGAIALSPIQPLPNNVAMAPERVVSNLSVDLAAAIDPITPWVNAFQTALQNQARLNAAWNASTLPIFQTFVQNQLYYASEFPQIGVIAQQIFGNVKAAIQAPLVSDPVNNISQTVVDVVQLPPPIGGIPVNQQTIYAASQDLLPESLLPLIEFTATPFSGAVLAVIGPVIGPVISMVNSVKATFEALKARNLPAAINEFLALAPNAVNAFLNGGQVLDLTDIVNRISPLPPEVTGIGLNMGGLVSSGLSPVEGRPSLGVTGSMFDGLAVKASLGGLAVDSPGLSVGPIGATQLLTKRIAEAIKQPKPTTAAAVAPAAAVAEVEAAAPEAVAEVEAADEAPAPKRQARAAKAEKADKGNAGRAERGARRGN